MVGAGSLEEAKLSKKDESAKKPIERKKPLAGTEESADGPMEVDDAASLEQQGAIHLAAEEMYSLVRLRCELRHRLVTPFSGRRADKGTHGDVCGGRDDVRYHRTSWSGREKRGGSGKDMGCHVPDSRYPSG